MVGQHGGILPPCRSAIPSPRRLRHGAVRVRWVTNCWCPGPRIAAFDAREWGGSLMILSTLRPDGSCSHVVGRLSLIELAFGHLESVQEGIKGNRRRAEHRCHGRIVARQGGAT